MTLRPLSSIRPGCRFRLPGVPDEPETDIEGELLKSNECRARVRLAGKRREFTTADGARVEFVQPRYSDWSPGTLVELIGE